MNELIKINYETEQPSVSARDLHERLEIKSNFTTWFDRMGEYGFESGKDFIPKMEESTGGRPATDFCISVDMAKQICMIQRTDKGRQYRQYFLDLEKAWNTPEQIFARALKMADKTIDQLKTDNATLLEDVKRMRPKEIFADAVSASGSTMLVRDVAKLIKQNGVPIGEKRFYKWLRENGFVCKGSTATTQRAMELGLFVVVIRTVERGDGLPLETKTTKVTGKGQQYFINKFLSIEEKSA